MNAYKYGSSSPDKKSNKSSPTNETKSPTQQNSSPVNNKEEENPQVSQANKILEVLQGLDDEEEFFREVAQIYFEENTTEIRIANILPIIEEFGIKLGFEFEEFFEYLADHPVKGAQETLEYDEFIELVKEWLSSKVDGLKEKREEIEGVIRSLDENLEKIRKDCEPIFENEEEVFKVEKMVDVIEEIQKKINYDFDEFITYFANHPVHSDKRRITFTDLTDQIRKWLYVKNEELPLNKEPFSEFNDASDQLREKQKEQRQNSLGIFTAKIKKHGATIKGIFDSYASREDDTIKIEDLGDVLGDIRMSCGIMITELGKDEKNINDMEMLEKIQAEFLRVLLPNELPVPKKETSDGESGSEDESGSESKSPARNKSKSPKRTEKARKGEEDKRQKKEEKKKPKLDDDDKEEEDDEDKDNKKSPKANQKKKEDDDDEDEEKEKKGRKSPKPQDKSKKDDDEDEDDDDKKKKIKSPRNETKQTEEDSELDKTKNEDDENKKEETLEEEIAGVKVNLGVADVGMYHPVKRRGSIMKQAGSKRMSKFGKIQFADSLVVNKKNDVQIPFDQFLKILREYIMYNPSVLCIETKTEEEKEQDGSPQNEEQKLDLFRENMVSTIRQYEMLQDRANNDLEKSQFETLIKTLKLQLEQYDQKAKAANENKAETTNFKKTKMDIEERRKKGLTEIFFFYSRQVLLVGKKATFDQIKTEMEKLNLGEYIRFGKDYEIPLDKRKLTEIFKKCSVNSRDLTFDGFITSLRRIGVEMNNIKLEEHKKRLNELEKVGKISKKKKEDEEKEKDKEEETEEKEQKDEEEEEEAKSDEEKSDEEEEGSGQDDDEKKEKKEKKKSSKITNLKKAALAGVEAVEDAMSSVAKIAKKRLTEKEQQEEEIRAMAEKRVKEREEEERKEREIEEKKKEEEEFERKKREDPIFNEKLRITKQIETLSNKTEDDLYEDIIQFIGCDDPTKYRKKAIGFALPFNIREKYERIPEGDPSKTYKFKSKKTAAEIKKDVQRMKGEREQRKKQKELEEKVKYEKNRSQLKKMHEQLSKERETKAQEKDNVTYQAIRNKQMGIEPDDKHQKITWEILGHLSYKDINQDGEDDFKPSDILEEEDEDYETVAKQVVESPRNVEQQQKQKVPEKALNKNSNKQKSVAEIANTKKVQPQPVVKDDTKVGYAAKKRGGQPANQSEIRQTSAPPTKARNEVAAQAPAQALKPKKSVKPDVSPPMGNFKKAVEKQKQVLAPRMSGAPMMQYPGQVNMSYDGMNPPFMMQSQIPGMPMYAAMPFYSYDNAANPMMPAFYGQPPMMMMANPGYQMPPQQTLAKSTSPVKKNISSQIMERASYIAAESKQKEDRQLNQGLKIHDNQLKKGMDVVKKGAGGNKKK